MARLFDDASSEYLTYAGALLAGVPITMAVWINADALPNADMRIMCISDASALEWINIIIRRHDQVDADEVWAGLGGSGSYPASKSGNTIGIGAWHHAGGVFATNASRIAYLDGVAGVEDTTDLTPANLDVTDIAAIHYNNTTNNYFSGHIGEAAIWNIALTNAEVASLAAGYSPLFIHPQNLIAYWDLIRGLNDRVGGYNLTASGTVVSVHPPIIYPAAPMIVTAPAAVAGAEFELLIGAGGMDGGFLGGSLNPMTG